MTSTQTTDHDQGYEKLCGFVAAPPTAIGVTEDEVEQLRKMIDDLGVISKREHADAATATLRELDARLGAQDEIAVCFPDGSRRVPLLPNEHTVLRAAFLALDHASRRSYHTITRLFVELDRRVGAAQAQHAMSNVTTTRQATRTTAHVGLRLVEN